MRRKIKGYYPLVKFPFVFISVFFTLHPLFVIFVVSDEEDGKVMMECDRSMLRYIACATNGMVFVVRWSPAMVTRRCVAKELLLS